MIRMPIGAAPDQLDRLEHLTGKCLPPALRELLEYTNGGLVDVENQWIDRDRLVPGMPCSIYVEELLSTEGIVADAFALEDELADDMLPFANDGADGIFIVDLNGKVYFFDYLSRIPEDYRHRNSPRLMQIFASMYKFLNALGFSESLE